MTLCPIAIVAGCQKCPAFKVCPLKGVIGDQPAAGAAPSKPAGQDVRARRADGADAPRGGWRHLSRLAASAARQSSPCLSASEVNESA